MSAKTASEVRGPVYVDSSALAKLYFPEVGSSRVDELLRGRGDLVVSDLAVTEIISAAARRRREGFLTREHLTTLYREILEDCENGSFQRSDLIPSAHRAAERLLLSSSDLPLRAADALHVALALAAGCATVLTYDERLAEAARAEGLLSLR